MTYKIKTGTRLPPEHPETEAETLALMKEIAEVSNAIGLDPKSKIGVKPGDLYLLNKPAREKRDNLAWQIYHLEKHLRVLRGEKVTYPFAGHNHG